MSTNMLRTTSLKAEFHRSHAFLFVEERQGGDAFFDETTCPYSALDARQYMWNYGYLLARDWNESMELLRAEWRESMNAVNEADLHG